MYERVYTAMNMCIYTCLHTRKSTSIWMPKSTSVCTDGAAAAVASLGDAVAIKEARVAAIRATTNRGRPEAATRGVVAVVEDARCSYPICRGRLRGTTLRIYSENAVKSSGMFFVM